MSEIRESVELTCECDVLVIGSGPSGYCAAIQAGREGCDTILIEKDDVLGGNSGPNLGVGITGADRYNEYAAETGVIQELEEVATWQGAYTRPAGYSICRRNEAIVQEHLEQAGVRVLKRHYARLPVIDDADGRRIAAVIVEDLAAFRTVRIRVRHVVIEASGDGEIGARAGADFDVGSEGRDEFHERSAPPQRAPLVQGTSLTAIAYRTDSEIPFQPPTGTPSFQVRTWHGTISSFLNHIHDRWFTQSHNLVFLYVTEAGGHMDTVKDDAEIYEMLLKQLWAEWDHIKNGPHKEMTANWDLLWVSPKAGKRESRRFLGDYVLTQTDLESGRLFPDDIAYGGHDLDEHRALGESTDIYGHSIPPLYGVPYRCCYSRNVSNLFLGGRLISATHLAHASTRVMRTGAAIGHALGIAASICRQRACTPRDVYDQHLDELQQRLLASDGTILDRSAGPDSDLARSAKVIASSEMRFNDQEPADPMPLICHAGNILWDWAPELRAVELYLKNSSREQQALTLSIHRARRDPKWQTLEYYYRHRRSDLTDQAFTELARVDSALPPRFNGWYRVQLPSSLHIGEKDPLSDDDRLLIALEMNEHVHWATTARRSEIAEMVEHGLSTTAWHALGVTGTMRLSPAPHLGEAANTVNGFHRRFSRAPLNLWHSDPSQPLPQDLTLSWPQPVMFDEIAVTFDNLVRGAHQHGPRAQGKRSVDGCVRAYVIHALQDGAWEPLVSVDDNSHRFRRHRVDPTTTKQLRLRILGTQGEGQSARVYQVSVWKRERTD